MVRLIAKRSFGVYSLIILMLSQNLKRKMADKRHIIKEIVTDGIRLKVREFPYNLKELQDITDSSKVVSIEAGCYHSAYYYIVEFQDGTARHFRHDQVDSVISDVWYKGNIGKTIAKAKNKIDYSKPDWWH